MALPITLGARATSTSYLRSSPEIINQNQPVEFQLPNIRVHLSWLQGICRGFPTAGRMCNPPSELPPQEKLPVSYVASRAWSICTGDFCPTLLLSKHQCMTFSLAPDFKVLIPLHLSRPSTELTRRAKEVCQTPLYYHTPTVPRNLHLSQTPPFPPWAPF